MAPTYVGKVDSTTSSSTLSLTLPAGYQADDLLLCVINSATNAGPVGVVDSGWTTLYSDDDQVYVGYKLSSGSEGSVTVNSNGGSFNRATASISVYRDVHELSYMSTPDVGTSTPVDVPEDTIATDSVALLTMWLSSGTVSGSIGAVPGSYTEIFDITGGTKKHQSNSYWINTGSPATSPSGSVAFSGTVSERGLVLMEFTPSPAAFVTGSASFFLNPQPVQAEALPWIPTDRTPPDSHLWNQQLITNATATVPTVAAAATVGTPTVTTQADATATPTTVVGTASVGAPTVQVGSTLTATAVTAVAAVGAVTAQAGSSVTAATVAAVATVGSVAVQGGSTAVVGSADLTFSAQTPTVTVGAVTAATGSADLTFSAQAATVTIGNVTFTTGTADLVFTAQAPTIASGTSFATGTADLTFSAQAPTVTAGAVTVVTGSADLTLSAQVVTLVAGAASVATGSADLSFGAQAPTVVAGAVSLVTDAASLVFGAEAPAVTVDEPVATGTASFVFHALAAEPVYVDPLVGSGLFTFVAQAVEAATIVIPPMDGGAPVDQGRQGDEAYTASTKRRSFSA